MTLCDPYYPNDPQLAFWVFLYIYGMAYDEVFKFCTGRIYQVLASYNGKLIQMSVIKVT